MERHAARMLSGPILGLLLSVAPGAAQESAPWPPPNPLNRPEDVVLQALRANPVTSPYPITASLDKGRIVLSGRVGTTAVHDAAVRTVIDLGYPLRDDLVIDTAEAHRVALRQTIDPAPGSRASIAGSAPYFVYPPPLFGRVDDPFFGLEPPLVSFPPWATRPAEPAPATAARKRPAAGPVKGQIELTVDAAGQVFLRGLVASEADKKVIEDEARNTPGVTRVYSELKVAPRRSDEPPPPPQPYQPEAPPTAPPAPRAEPRREPPAPGNRPAPAPAARPEAGAKPSAVPAPGFARDGQKLTRRVADALSRSPSLSGLPIAVSSRGDVVTLAGKLPSAYEAMLAYRAVEQTPGVRDIVDQLEFPVPDENHPNPLRQKARPDDLEPYLTSQIRRHLGELAHVDRVRGRGDLLEIRGTIVDAADRDRVQAILRSMPLLREFRIDAAFQSSR